MEIEKDRIKNIMITGDFFMYPEEALRQLEVFLSGVRAKEDVVRKRVGEFYARTGVQTPLMAPEDFARAIIKALQVRRTQ